MREHVKKKRTFLPDLITLRSIRFTIVRSPGTRFFSLELKRSKQKEKERKKERFTNSLRSIESKLYYDMLRSIVDEGEKGTNDRDRYGVTSAIVPEKSVYE